MSTDPHVLDMLGDTLRDTVTAARTRLADDTVMAGCTEGLWLVERAGEPIETGLTYDACVAAVEALT